MDVVEFKRSDVVRQGNDAVYSSETKQEQMDRLITVLGISTGVVAYTFVAAGGLTTARVWYTNNTNPPVFTKWHSPLDAHLRASIHAGRLRSVESRDSLFVVRYNNPDSLGRFSTLAGFSGLSGGF
jgi:hypothetical protein